MLAKVSSKTQKTSEILGPPGNGIAVEMSNLNPLKIPHTITENLDYNCRQGTVSCIFK